MNPAKYPIVRATHAPAPIACETIVLAINQRTNVKMKPLMMVPQSESNGFFNVPSSDWCDGAQVARRAAVSF
jgi:hypothetical protein